MGKKFVSIFLPFLLLLLCFWAGAQDAETIAGQYIKQYRKHVSDASLQKKLNQGSPDEIIGAFMSYTSDSLPEIRSVARYQIALAGLRSDKDKLRRKAVSLILKGLDDNDANAISILSDFKPSDFTPEHRYTISQKAKAGSFQHDKLILLTGYLNLTDLIYNYKLMLNEKQYSSRVKTALHFAMARMGDTTSVNFLEEKLTSVNVNDDIVYSIFHLLAYSRQKVFFDFLLENILSEEKNCLSSNPDKEVPIICAYRIMEMVAPYIQNFPVKVDESGELVSGDYNKTLMEVKEWIKVHKTDYNLIYDVY